MKDIKFRAWDSNMKRTTSTGRMMYFTLEEAIHGQLMDECGCCDIDEHHKIMRFVGLKDKNNKEIYEEDILQPHRFNTDIKLVPVIVRYCDHEFVADSKFGGGTNWLKYIDLNDVQVIGNIFENPELLEVAK